MLYLTLDVSKKTSITDNQSSNLGYIEYPPNAETTLTLKPGVKYNLSFDCAAKDKWYNMVSDGDEDGADASYGDKVPWVQLYSASVSRQESRIVTVSDLSPSPSATWNASYTSKSLGLLSPTSTSGTFVDDQFYVFQD